MGTGGWLHVQRGHLCVLSTDVYWDLHSDNDATDYLIIKL